MNCIVDSKEFKGLIIMVNGVGYTMILFNWLNMYLFFVAIIHNMICCKWLSSYYPAMY